MNLKKLIKEIKDIKENHNRLSKKNVYGDFGLNNLEDLELIGFDSQLKGIKQVVEYIESLCEKESDGLEVYENRHEEGKGDGIWINAEDLIKIKQSLSKTNREEKD